MTDPLDPSPRAHSTSRAHLLVLSVVQLIMAAQFVLFMWLGDWAHAFLVAALMAVMIVPVVFRLPVEIPSEIQIVAVAFTFCTLFLGEMRGYYELFWWWDAALHTTSGLLLGMLGFLLVYVLNEDRQVDLHLAPSFVALFAFFFAVGIGAIWEIFEFGMDYYFNTNMQPATENDPSGLTDTIQDLIVDTVGAAVVSLAAWRYMARPHEARLDTWVSRFIKRNPQLFRD